MNMMNPNQNPNQYSYVNNGVGMNNGINNDKPAGDFPLPMKADNDYVWRLEMAEPLQETERIAYENELGFSYR